MKKEIPIKLNDFIFVEMEKIRKEIKKSRNTYIIDALNFYNRLQAKKFKK